MSTDSPEQTSIVPYYEKKGGKFAYFWTTCIAKPTAVLVTKSTLIGSQIGNLIAHHSRILPKLPEISFNCDIKANLSINSRSFTEEKEKLERCQRIAQLEKEVCMLRSQVGISEFGNSKYKI